MTSVLWLSCLIAVAFLVLLDLGLYHREKEIMKVPEALAWTVFWTSLALAFNVFLYFHYARDGFDLHGVNVHQLTGTAAGLQFFTGYLLERSLSIDNIFVIAMIFSFFRIPLEEQRPVLVWGILGIVLLRGVMLLAGVGLFDRYEWVPYALGAVLIVSAVKMLIIRHDSIEPGKNLIVMLTRKFYSFTREFDAGRFFTWQNGKRLGTPLLLALILVVTSDLMFAVNSVPAILTVTRDPFLILTSNLFAVLGLRALYFALAGYMDRFRYLKTSLVFILAYVGIKTLLIDYYPISNLVSLAIICGILAIGVVGSVTVGGRDPLALLSPLVDDLEELAALTYRQARRVVILIVGSSLLLVGVVMIFLPGPAILVIPLGLTVLSIEFAWARLWLRKFKKRAKQFKQGVNVRVKKLTRRSG